MEKYKNRILIFIGLSYFLSWMIWLPLFINDTIKPSYLITIGTFIPSIVGIFLYFKTHNTNIKTFLKEHFKFRMKLKYYLSIFLLPLAIVLSAYVLMRLLNLAVPDISYLWYEIPIVFITIIFLMGPLGEEFGWRGYLFPVLKEKYSVFQTSIMIGFIWTLWHLPKFFIEDVLQNEFTKLYGIGLSLIGYLFYTICLSFLISVYFEKTKRSIVTPLVMHTMANLSIGLIPLVFNQTGALIQLSLMFLFVVVIYIKNRSWINKKPL